MSANNQGHNEAPLSVNWRMLHTGETFQFTLRDSDEASFVQRLNDMIIRLGQEGWQFSGELVQPQGAQAQPVPGMQVQMPVSVRAGTPGTSPAVKAENIEGYVVGGYNGRDGKQGVVVYLYTSYGQYASYRVYPERASLLPFTFPTVIEWNGGAPDKAAADKGGFYHRMPFVVTVVPDTNDDGSFKLSAKGYQKYRLPKVGEIGEPDNGLKPTRNNATPIAGLVNFAVLPGEMYPDNSIHWIMVPDETAVAKLNIPTPLDEWLVELREGVGMLTDVNPENPKTQTTTGLWSTLQQWCVQQAGVVAGGDTLSVEIAAGKRITVPLAGVLTGMLIDRYSSDPKEIPADLTVGILQRVMKQKGVGIDNPTHNQDFEDNLGELLRLTCEAHGATQELAF